MKWDLACWSSKATCQVKLSVSGQRVEKLLENIAADLGPKSPIPAAAIRKLATDPAELRRLSQGALRRARELSWDAKVQQIVQVYEQILDAQPARR